MRETSNVTLRESFRACMTGKVVVMLTEEQDGNNMFSLYFPEMPSQVCYPRGLNKDIFIHAKSQKCSSHATFDRKFLTVVFCQNEGMYYKKRSGIWERGVTTQGRGKVNPRMTAKGDPRMAAVW